MSVLNDLNKLLHSRFPLFLFLIISFSLFPIIPEAWSATYYVDATNGKDTYHGLSPAEAWGSIAGVSSPAFRPGDYVLFKRGEIWREEWIFGSHLQDVPQALVACLPIIMQRYGDSEIF